MIKKPKFSMTCKNCGGTKYVGDEFYLFGELWVDITCINCAHSVDIEVKRFNDFVDKVEGHIYDH